MALGAHRQPGRCWSRSLTWHYIIADAIRIVREDVVGDVQRIEYAYDFRNRLTSANLFSDAGGTTHLGEVKYGYDVLDRRVYRELVNAEISRFIYDGQQVVREMISNSGSWTDQHLFWGAGGQLVSFEDTAGGVIRTTAWTLTDQNGTVQDLVGRRTGDDAGVLYSTYRYNSFGNLALSHPWLELSGTTFSQNLRYTFGGRHFDAYSGLQYLGGGVYYSPFTHRLMTQSAADTNPYRFAGNSPQNTLGGEPGKAPASQAPWFMPSSASKIWDYVAHSMPSIHPAGRVFTTLSENAGWANDFLGRNGYWGTRDGVNMGRYGMDILSGIFDPLPGIVKLGQTSAGVTERHGLWGGAGYFYGSFVGGTQLYEAYEGWDYASESALTGWDRFGRLSLGIGLAAGTAAGAIEFAAIRYPGLNPAIRVPGLAAVRNGIGSVLVDAWMSGSMGRYGAPTLLDMVFGQCRPQFFAQPSRGGVNRVMLAAGKSKLAKQLLIEADLKTFELSGGWRDAGRRGGLANRDSIVYIVRDTATGEVLKVGETGTWTNRFGEYVLRAQKEGRIVNVDTFTIQSQVKLDRVAIERQIRLQLKEEGHVLPWDKTKIGKQY